MTDLEYVVKCCHAHAKQLDAACAHDNNELMNTDAENNRLRARNDALIRLATARKPRSKTAKHDHELAKLLEEYPI